MLGGLFLRGATRTGAVAGLLTGFGLWLYTLFLPSFGSAGLVPESLLSQGPWGLEWLRPAAALFGVVGLDPLLHALVWSLGLNTLVFAVVSILSFPGPIERSQGLAFVNVFDCPGAAREWRRGMAEAEDLLALSQGILGAEEAQDFFAPRPRGKASAASRPSRPRFHRPAGTASGGLGRGRDGACDDRAVHGRGLGQHAGPDGGRGRAADP